MKKQFLALTLAVLALCLSACGIVPGITLPTTGSEPAAAQTTASQIAETGTEASETPPPETQSPETEPTEAPEPVTEPTQPAADEEPEAAVIYLNGPHPDPEDPWGIIRQTEMRYKQDDKVYALTVPYLCEEVYVEEENMYYDYSENRTANDRIAAMASGTVVSAVTLLSADQSDFEYEVHVWDDLLVLKTSCWDRYAETVYHVYVIDASDIFWRHLTTEQLLERMGISKEYFLETLRRQLTEAFEENWGNSPMKEYYPEDYAAGLAEAGSEEYVNLELQAFPDGTGQLYVVADYLSMVGAGSYQGILKLDMPEGWTGGQ